MFLFELAMELGVRSADMADAAPQLGLVGISPTTELTPEQAEVLRAKFTKGRPLGAPANGLAPDSPPLSAPVAPGEGDPSRGGSRSGAVVGIAVAVIASLALFGFMAVNSGPDKEREAQLEREAAIQDAKDAKAYEAGGTVGGSAAGEPAPTAAPNVPTDIGRFCRAGLALHDHSTDLSAKINADDYEGTKATMIAGLDRWKANVAEMRATLPSEAAEKGRIYEEFYGNFYLTWINSASIDDLRPKVLAMDTTVSSAAWHDLQTMIFENCE